MLVRRRLLFRKSTFDPVVGVYALLDRADGSSIDGPNQNISIADIERLERLEAVCGITHIMNIINIQASNQILHSIVQ